jgi:phosphopantothenoylcysteine decarboxylase/phosphopantothenate--cysteine ligase
VQVETAREMRQEVLSRFPNCHVLIAAAAVADYSADDVAPGKLKRGGDVLKLELRPTPDILAECGKTKGQGQLLVGFAAETEDLLPNARRKLAAKNLDLIVANEVARPGVGFESDRNAGHLLFPDGRETALPEMTKSEFADRVLDAVAETRERRDVRSGDS